METNRCSQCQNCLTVARIEKSKQSADNVQNSLTGNSQYLKDHIKVMVNNSDKNTSDYPCQGIEEAHKQLEAQQAARVTETKHILESADIIQKMVDSGTHGVNKLNDMLKGLESVVSGLNGYRDFAAKETGGNQPYIECYNDLAKTVKKLIKELKDAQMVTIQYAQQKTLKQLRERDV